MKTPSSPDTNSEAILATLAFFDLLHLPMNKKELRKHLLFKNPSETEFEEALTSTKGVQKTESYYHLQGSPSIKAAHEAKQWNQKLWKKVERYRWVFRITPFLKLVTICNTLAIGNASKKSDIDLFIVTEPHRLFTSRLVLTFWLQLLGIRRHGSKIAGRFCLSFFITTEHLNLGNIRKPPCDIYLAYWLKTLKPIYEQEQTHTQLKRANEHWMKEFFPNFPNSHNSVKSTSRSSSPFFKGFQEKILNTKWGEKLENFLKKWQLERAQIKRSKLGLETKDSAVILSEHMLKFHNEDRRNEIYTQWKKRINDVLSS